MAEIVNLRRVRKDRQRRAAEREADDNRVRHGTPKALRETARIESARQARRLDGASLSADRRDPPATAHEPLTAASDPATGKPPPQ